MGAQSKDSGTELPHEKFHPASYGAKILLTIQNLTLARFIRFLNKQKSLENLKTVCRPQNTFHISVQFHYQTCFAPPNLQYGAPLDAHGKS